MRRRRLLLDVRSNVRTGIARYSNELASGGIPALEQGGVDTLVVAREMQRRTLAGILTGSRTNAVYLSPREDGGYWRESTRMKELIVDFQPDLVYTTNYFLEAPTSVKSVVTIHDLTRLVVPASASTAEMMSAYGAAEHECLLQRARRRGLDPRHDDVFYRLFESRTRESVEQADMVATVSGASQQQLVTVLGVERKKLRVVPPAVSPVFLDQPVKPLAAVSAALRPHGFILAVGLKGHHKRAAWLLDQFAAVQARLPAASSIVVVGTTPSDLPSRLLRHPGVVLVGDASDVDLRTLYACAAGYVSASLSEGYSLPPGEALAAGTEAIVTDIPVHRDLLGRHVHLYAVDDGRRLQSLMVDALLGQLEVRAAGFRPPTWDTSVRAFVALVREILDAG